MALEHHGGANEEALQEQAANAPKAQGRKAARLKRRAQPRSDASPPPPPTSRGKIARLTRERDEAPEQQTATSEVLHVISTSRGELEPVFQTMLERAVRICEAKFGALYRFDGNALHLAAQVGASRELAELRSRLGPFQPTPGGLLDLVLRTKRVNYVADQTAGPSGPAPAPPATNREIDEFELAQQLVGLQEAQERLQSMPIEFARPPPRLERAEPNTVTFDSRSEEGEILIRWGFKPKVLSYIPNIRGAVTGVP